MSAGILIDKSAMFQDSYWLNLLILFLTLPFFLSILQILMFVICILDKNANQTEKIINIIATILAILAVVPAFLGHSELLIYTIVFTLLLLVIWMIRAIVLRKKVKSKVALDRKFWITTIIVFVVAILCISMTRIIPKLQNQKDYVVVNEKVTSYFC